MRSALTKQGSSEMNAAVAATPRRPHRVLVPALLTIATVLGFWACFALWVNRQMFNTNNWVSTSSKVLADPTVQQALGPYLVDELFKGANVPLKLREALPPRAEPLAGPIAAGLHAVAERAAPRLLASNAVQEVWRRINRAAHAEFLRVVENKGRAGLSTGGGVVALNLSQLITELAAQVGLAGKLEEARSNAAAAGARAAAEAKLGLTLPAKNTRLVILRSNELRTGQDIVQAIKGFAIVLPLLSIALFALAVFLARGWRRFALRSTGWCFTGVGIAVLLIRRAVGHQLVNDLVHVPANKPAAEAVWSISTSLLRNIGIATLIYGVSLLVASWLAGSTRPAVALRRISAPWMQRNPVGTYLAAAFMLLLIVIWGPTPATRTWLGVLVLAALLALGVTVLRTQAIGEFSLAGTPALGANAGLGATSAGEGAGRPDGRGEALAGAPDADRAAQEAETREQTTHGS